MTITIRLALCGLLVLLPAAARAAGEENFYQGKTITMLVGFAVGAGNDSYTRLLTRHLGRHIPGAPNFVVENLPKMGSARGVLALDRGAGKDGTAIATFSPDLIVQSILGTSNTARIDFDKLAWLGSLAKDGRVCIAWHEAGVRNWQDLEKRAQFTIGVTSPGESAYRYSALLKNMFGIRVRIVTGYSGSAEEKLAMERREIDGQCGSWSSIPAGWIENNKVDLLVRFSSERAPDMPEAPSIVDLAKSDSDRKVLDLLLTTATLGRPYVLSRGVPEARIEILRKAFDATMQDPEFLADAAKQKLPISAVSGSAAQALIDPLYAMPDTIIAAAKAAIE